MEEEMRDRKVQSQTKGGWKDHLKGKKEGGQERKDKYDER